MTVTPGAIKPRRSVRLDPMTEQEFAAYLAEAVGGYAEHQVEAGNFGPDEALERARAEFDVLLPDGRESPDQYTYTARDAESGEPVGTYWISVRPNAGKMQAFIYFVGVYPQQQGKGYGRAVMLAGMDKARELGAERIALHVFGNNTVARSLYQSLGFVETDVSMALDL